jgi:hypothetical protein
MLILQLKQCWVLVLGSRGFETVVGHAKPSSTKSSLLLVFSPTSAGATPDSRVIIQKSLSMLLLAVIGLLVKTPTREMEG